MQPNSTFFHLAHAFRKKVEVGAVFKINSLENMTKLKKKKHEKNTTKLCKAMPNFERRMMHKKGTNLKLHH